MEEVTATSRRETRTFNKILESERMPEECWRCVLLIFRNKGDVHNCGNYRGIKLMSYTMKLSERVVEARLQCDELCLLLKGNDSE